MKIIPKIIMSAFLLMAITLYGQEGEMDNRESLRFGFKAGFNLSNAYNSEPDDFIADAKPGFVGGVALSIPISKYLGIQPEVLFSQKGFKGEGQLLSRPYKFTRTTSHLDFPLQIALKPSEFITIVAGPQYSLQLRKKDKFTSSDISFSQEEEIKNDNIRKSILGVIAGIDVNIQHITVGARTGWDLQDNNGKESSPAPRYKNAWLQLTLGYTF